MNYTKQLAEVLLLLVQIPPVQPATPSIAQQRPEVYVERPACPFECCTYREWSARRPTPVYASPARAGKRIRTLAKGEHVEATTGFVRTHAGRFLVTSDKGPYRAGETIWVYTYHGEGTFLVWYKGKMYDEDLGFSPYGGSSGTRGEAGGTWGHLTTEHKSEWWIQLRLHDGRTGWTNRGGDYANTDACGFP